jgi:hypothetical protein
MRSPHPSEFPHITVDIARHTQSILDAQTAATVSHQNGRGCRELLGKHKAQEWEHAQRLILGSAQNDVRRSNIFYPMSSNLARCKA